MEQNENDPLSYQVGGSHYSRYEYQPIEFFNDTRLDFNRANAIKYLTRWKEKGGVEDLKKALQYIEFTRQQYRKQAEPFRRFVEQFDGLERDIISCIWLDCFDAAEMKIKSLIQSEQNKN